VIKLGPGIYDLGTNNLQMKEYVDMEGSGENTTIIQGSIDNGGLGVVNGANNAEIRFLTVSNTGGGFYAMAISNSSASPKITNVTAKASGATSINIGVYNHGSSPTMTNVTVSASGALSSYGVYNDSASAPTMTNVTVNVSAAVSTYGVTNISSSATMTNVTVNPSGGSSSNQGVLNLANSGRTVKINHSVIQGTTETIYNGSGTTLVGNTQLDGAAVSDGGTLTCVGAYNGSYAALNTSCQP
jgi:hypothetical protein